MADKRAILVGAIGVAVVYFLIVPAFWSAMPPNVAASIPTEWQHNQDMQLDIRVSSVHSNYKVTQVRLYFDPLKTNLTGLSEPLQPIVIVNAQGPQKWNPLTVNRLTFPRRKTMRLLVPLSQLAEAGKFGPGTAIGTLDVMFSAAGSASSNNRALMGDSPSMNMAQIPFQMQFL